ncbi:DUF3857 domain-containing protein [Xanthomonas citri pv. citri]|nr:DUF3857 domain-containing protein [Xanthomonas citri pv. citri]
MLHRPSLVLVLLLCIPLLAQAQQRPAPAASAATRTQADTNYSFVRYRADYEVRADASSVETDEYEILLKTKSAVEQFSQVRLSYSEKMETLEVLQAYTVTAEGLRLTVSCATAPTTRCAQTPAALKPTSTRSCSRPSRPWSSSARSG